MRKLEENIFWLYDAIRSPQVIPLRAMVVEHFLPEESEQLWSEVERAREKLINGGHFQDLALPLVRQLAVHFHLALVL